MERKGQPTKDEEARQCKGLLGYANQFEKLLLDQETQLICRESEHVSRQICLPQNCFLEAFNVAYDHGVSGHPESQKTLMFLKGFFSWTGLYKRVQILTKTCLTC